MRTKECADIIEVTEGIYVEDVDIHRREEHIRYETGEHMPWIKREDTGGKIYFKSISAVSHYRSNTDVHSPP